MLRNVEFSERPERLLYEERDNLYAMLTMADNIREGVNPEGNDVWYADLYTLTLTKTDALYEQAQQNFELFLEEAKRKDAIVPPPTEDEKRDAQILYTALMTDTLIEED